MLTFPFNWFTVATSESLVTSLAAGGVRGVVRNHGYGNQNFSAALTRQGRDLMSVGVRRLPAKGRISSLLCLCGISVSVVVYLLYTKFFYPRSYYSAILTKLVRRLLLRRNRERVASLWAKRSTAVPSNSTSGEQPNDDDVSKTTESPCPSVRVSSSCISSSRNVVTGEDDIIRVPSSQLKCRSSGPRPSDRHRRRTHSESLDLPRLDDFICLIPEIVRPPRYGRGTRNVIDWLAQIAVEVDGDGHREERFPDREEEDGGGDDDDDGVGETALVRSVGGHRRAVVGCVPSDGRLGRDLDVDGIEAIVVQTLFGDPEDVKTRLEMRGSRDDNTEAVKEEEEEEEEEKGVDSRGHGLRKSIGALLRRESPLRNRRWIDGESEVAESEDGTTDRFYAPEDVDTPSKVFYFEDEDEEGDFTSGVLSLHRGAQPSLAEQQQQRRQHHHHHQQQQQQQQQHDILKPLSRLGQQPDDHTRPAGGTGYEWMRARLLGPTTRKRLTSADSRASLDLLAAAVAAQGLTRNHFSFNSELSAASSDYTYRESLLSKGLSVDGGEDLDRLVVPGDDLLYAADLSRWTLTNIDQLHEELEHIQRDICDINSKVEVLQSREDLADFASRYDISGVSREEERRNSIGYHSNTDLRMLQSSTMLSRRRRRRSRSTSSLPLATFDPEEGFGVCEPDDLNLHSAQGDGFAWDYDDPGLTPTPTHYALRRSSNTFRLDDVQRLEVLKSNRERQFVFHNDEEEDEEDEEEEEEEDHADWDEQLSRSSLSDCDDDPDAAAAEHPAAEYPTATDDEYIDDGYEVLTRFQQ